MCFIIVLCVFNFQTSLMSDSGHEVKDFLDELNDLRAFATPVNEIEDLTKTKQFGVVIEVGYLKIPEYVLNAYSLSNSPIPMFACIDKIDLLNIINQNPYQYLVHAELPYLFLRSLYTSLQDRMNCKKTQVAKRRKFSGSRVKIYNDEEFLDETYDKLMESMVASNPILFCALIPDAADAQVITAIAELIRRGDNAIFVSLSCQSLLEIIKAHQSFIIMSVRELNTQTSVCFISVVGA